MDENGMTREEILELYESDLIHGDFDDLVMMIQDIASNSYNKGFKDGKKYVWDGHDVDQPYDRAQEDMRE